MTEYAVVDPATGRTVREYPLISDEELDSVVGTADAAYRQWGRVTSAAERAAVVRRVSELHRERRDELAEIIVREMGKPLEQALGEVDFSADIYLYYADHAEEFLADEPISLADGSGSAFIRRSPVGVLLGIMPWNFPYYQVARFAGPNVVIGNSILLKHAPQCPESSAAIEQIFRDALAPEGVYTNIYASNDQAATLIADRRLQGVSLTGSERAGAAVAEIAGRNLKKVVLELGGSDPFIVLSADNLDEVVEGAVAARMDNNGQSCNAAKRFIVIDELYEQFEQKFVDRMRGITPTDPHKADAELGPLSSSAAASNIEDQLERAADQGAQVLTRGEPSGTFVSPAVLTDVTPSMDAFNEEFFGPVAQLYRVSSEEEAVELANATDFGLGSYVFTTDPEQAERVADQLEAGMVWINTVLGDAAELPFGGVKKSGFGRELGRLGAEEFVNKKMIRIAGTTPAGS
ncbi:NAD-dependent succinate-semialdehyde dehydrogenase [Arthrobacter echini]|uniref:NAD-dependent succinate-semialdehyde dehydrogenase n=1 Tax=Arthrobacter echini TaxID=1529066 RepID=A0A4S5E5Q0_9MICC|nr:NAD-dependent succinate-semialdehyde dehydrogenase [Arthrobacter echini]THJ66770.1 NAD-dependent succinate-semialdehyde dehydrogenase [Arthrobacter echini]